jgi:hypothetical protein
MRVICSWCHKELEPAPTHTGDTGSETSHGICPSCKDYFLSGKRPTLNEFLNQIPVPVLVVNPQGEIEFANRPALTLLEKDIDQVKGFKGGDAMECVYSRLPKGCGKTVHCKACTIRKNVTKTFESGQNLQRVPAYLNRRAGNDMIRINFLISTKKENDIVLLRIDQVGA